MLSYFKGRGDLMSSTRIWISIFFVWAAIGLAIAFKDFPAKDKQVNVVGSSHTPTTSMVVPLTSEPNIQRYANPFEDKLLQSNAKRAVDLQLGPEQRTNQPTTHDPFAAFLESQSTFPFLVLDANRPNVVDQALR